MHPKSFLFVLIFVFISSVEVRVSGIKVSFNGSHYIPMIQPESTPNDTNISLRVKTMHPSGILIYGRGKAGKLFLLETIQGRLRLVIDLGDKTHEILLGYNLANNRWHSVTVHHTPNKITLSLDNNKRTRLLTGSLSHIYLRNPIYVGGLDKSLVKTSDAVGDMPNFIGCLSDVYINSINVLYGASYYTSSNTTTGTLKLSCPRDNGLIEFPSRKSYIRLSKSSSPLRFSLHFSFRSYTKSGVIAYRAATNARVVISLVEGALELKVKVASVPEVNITIGKHLNNGEWHDVTSGVSTREYWLSLDNAPEERRSHRYLGINVRFQNHVFIGGGRKTRGFIGCMHNVRVNGDLVTSRKGYFVFGVAMNSCTLKSLCLPNPCKNDGKCKRQKDVYSCDCEGPLYRGRDCEIPVYRATCAEYRELGLSEDSYCMVDPERNPKNSFVVLCNVAPPNWAVTVIGHDKKTLHKVSQGTSQHDSKHYHYIDYRHANVANIKSLINKSRRCRQYISFHCFNTTILNPPNAQWFSGDGVAQDYWGGATKGSHECTCAVTSTCVHGKLCNCDVGDARWREDAGYITDKSALPVSLLQFTNQASLSMYTLGPLQCFGFNGASAKHVTNTTSYISQACRPANPRPTSVVPSSTRPNPTAWRLVDSTRSSSPPQSSSWVSYMIPESATMTTSITSSLTTELSTVKSDSSSLPLVSSEIPKPTTTTESRNDSKMHVPGKPSKDFILSRSYIILLVICIAIFILVVIAVFALRSRGVCGNCCCASQRSHNDNSVPDKSISHAMYSGSVADSVRPVSMEMGTYNVSNGQWLYQSVDQSGIVKKFVSFAPTQEETSLETF